MTKQPNQNILDSMSKAFTPELFASSHIWIQRKQQKCATLNVEFSTWNLTTIISVTMVFQNSCFWAINYYDQAKVGTALHTQGTPNTKYAGASLALTDRPSWRQPHRSRQARHLQTLPLFLAKTSIHKVSTSSIREPVLTFTAWITAAG